MSTHISTGLGLLAHFGQEEFTAGKIGCERLRGLGATHILIVDHRQGQHSSLVARTDGCIASGAQTTVLYTPGTVDGILAQLSSALGADTTIDGVLGMDAELTVPALAQYLDKNLRGLLAAVFDFGPTTATEMERGRVAFAIDQQQYLQGYLPVVYMALMNTTGLRFQPEQLNGLVPTGPGFITTVHPTCPPAHTPTPLPACLPACPPAHARVHAHLPTHPRAHAPTHLHARLHKHANTRMHKQTKSRTG